VKYIVLLSALLAVLPLAGWLRKHPQHTTKIWIAMGLLPFVIFLGPHPLYIAVISWSGWPGYVKGAEVSLIDVLALAIYLSQPRTKHPTPFIYSMTLYFVAALLSAVPSQVPMASLFFVWQLARMFLVYVVVARACTDDRVVPAILTGMGVGVCLNAVIAGWQRVGLGMVQTTGIIGEKNLLGLMTEFVGPPWFALLLAGQRGRMPYLAPLASAVTSVLTVSRAALGLNVLAMLMIFLLSAVRKWTSKKAKIALLSVLAVLALVPIAISSFESRFGSASVGGYDERAAFEKAAIMMLADYPFGVGANNYVIIANVEGYNERAGVALQSGSLSTNVHNAFLLSAAETGYFGLLAFVLVLSRPLIVAFRCGWRNRSDRRGDLLLGLGVAFLTIYIHCYFEWILLHFIPLYLFAITSGMVAGLAQQLGYWKSQTYEGTAAHEIQGHGRPSLRV
jgi:O-antigen ligase